MKYRLVLLIWVAVIVMAPGIAAARVGLSIGFGTWFGDCCHPYGWCGGWHRPWLWHPYGPVCAPGLGIWVHDPWPVVVETPPVVVERHVVVKEHAPARPPRDAGDTILSERLQQKRSELARRLRIGDVDGRITAAQELARFTGDVKAISALEQALLGDREAGVRKAAAESLGRLGSEKAVASLKQAYAEDASRDVRQAGYKALIMIEGY